MSDQQAQELHQQRNEGQDEKKSLLSSRFVERALSYSWIKYGWDTASRTYETVKQSNSLAKFGCELAENNVSKVVHSPLVEGGISFLAPLIVIADEFSVRQLDKVEKGADLSQRLVQKVVVDPVSSTYKAATSLPSRLLDRAEALVDYYLPEEKHKGDEGPTAGKSRRDSQEGRLSSLGRLFDLTCTTAQRTYARLGYESLKTQANEKLQEYQTLNDLIIYLRTSDPEKKEKLVKQGRDVYWNFRNNYKAIFVQAARSVVQPYLVSPTLNFYNSVSSYWNNIKRIVLRGPFAPRLATPASPSS
jgi:hypothetical protein